MCIVDTWNVRFSARTTSIQAAITLEFAAMALVTHDLVSYNTGFFVCFTEQRGSAKCKCCKKVKYILQNKHCQLLRHRLEKTHHLIPSFECTQRRAPRLKARNSQMQMRSWVHKKSTREVQVSSGQPELWVQPKLLNADSWDWNRPFYRVKFQTSPTEERKVEPLLFLCSPMLARIVYQLNTR